MPMRFSVHRRDEIEFSMRIFHVFGEHFLSTQRWIAVLLIYVALIIVSVLPAIDNLDVMA
jgi:hypothetical protein